MKPVGPNKFAYIPAILGLAIKSIINKLVLLLIYNVVASE